MACLESAHANLLYGSVGGVPRLGTDLGARRSLEDNVGPVRGKPLLRMYVGPARNQRCLAWWQRHVVRVPCAHQCQPQVSANMQDSVRGQARHLLHAFISIKPLRTASYFLPLPIQGLTRRKHEEAANLCVLGELGRVCAASGHLVGGVIRCRHPQLSVLAVLVELHGSNDMSCCHRIRQRPKAALGPRRLGLLLDLLTQSCAHVQAN
jgi:hypothetical protein